HFFAPDGVGILHDSHLLGRHIADDADGKPRAGEGLAGYQILRQAQFTPRLPDFIFEQVAQRFYDFLKIHIVRQTAHIVVALDRGGLAAQAALHHVGVDGALRQKIYRADLFGFLFKDADKLLPDDLALAFGGFHTGQFAVETLAGVHADKVDIEPAALAKDLTDLFPLVFAKQAMIHEHTGELLADRLGSMAAHTLESTPPESAQRTLPPPIFSRSA